MASLTCVLAIVAVVATASANVHSDCSIEASGGDVRLLQANPVEKQRGVTRQAKKELEPALDVSSTADRGLNNSTAIGGVALLEEQDWKQSGKKRDKVVFIKLHKVGGTTLAQIMRRRCDNAGFRCAGVVKSSSLYTTVTHDGLRSLASEHAGKFDIWAHHVVLDTELLDTLVPGNVKIALFRNPSDRVLSSFRHGASYLGPQIATDIVHALQQNKWPVELCNDPDRLFHEASHSQFCCGPAAGMAMSGQIPLEHFDKLDLVMLTEEMDMSIVMFRRFVNWDLADMLYLRLRDYTAAMTPELKAANAVVDEYLRGGNTTITTEAGQRFYSNCVSGDEAKLYDMAKRKYQQQWDSFSPSEQEELHAELAVFREGLATLASCCAEHTDDVYCVEQSQITDDWFLRHGGIVESPESLPYPMLENLQMPPRKDLAGLAHSMCKGQALSVLHESSVWQRV